MSEQRDAVDPRSDWRRFAMRAEYSGCGIEGVVGATPEERTRLYALRCAVWMKSRKVDTADGRKRRHWVCAWQEFFLRAAGEWRSRGMDTQEWWNRASHIEDSLPKDHCGVFFRDGVPVCVTIEPYTSGWTDEMHGQWVQIAARYGLHLTWSLGCSWHFPGRTILYELWLPQTFPWTEAL